MKTCVLIFLTLTVNSCQAQDQNPRENIPSSECKTAIEHCGIETMTSGRCRTTWRGFQLDMNRNDQSNDCQAEGPDYIYDVTHNYDTNGDEQLCGDEWTARRTGYNGFSSNFTEFEWDTDFSPSGQCVPMSAFSSAAPIPLKTLFSNRSISRLVNMCSNSENMANNRDCYGLILICKEKRPELDTCKSFDQNILSLYERLQAVRKANDADGDGMMTPEEMQAVLTNGFDTDNSSCITLEEWTARWTMVYQFTPEYAAYELLNTVGNQNCFSTNVMQMPPGGVPVAPVLEGLVTRIIDMCEGTPSLYDTNSDCAMISDVCSTHYPKLEACRIYTDNCGLQRYAECVLQLTGSDCSSKQDGYAAILEFLRTQNQINYYCTPGDGEFYWNAAAYLTIRLASLLVTSLISLHWIIQVQF